MSLLGKIIGKRDGQLEGKPTAPLPEQLPYPVQVNRRRYQKEDVRKRGGVQVFDTPGALALNAARMDHLESLGLSLKGKRALDLGCGVGHLGLRLQQIAASHVAAYHIGGWYDGFTLGTLLWNRNYPNSSKLLMGPWFHPASAQFDMAGEYLRWFEAERMNLQAQCSPHSNHLSFTLSTGPPASRRSVSRHRSD